ncbi:MAG: Ig-like domain-containing protein, partial [Methylococcales bacterium]|nr:Ig-like domain-containing protein [Methylococcales bacterium]
MIGITVTNLPPAAAGVLYLADGNTVVLAGTPLTPNQATTLVFKPVAGFIGSVDIPFTVTDNKGAVSLASDTIVAVNGLPIATPTNIVTNANNAVKVNLTGTDPDGTLASISVTTPPTAAQGILYLADGTTPVAAGAPLSPAQAAGLVFQPTAGYTGSFSIPFTVTDNQGGVLAASNVTIDVDALPVATPASVVTLFNTATTINLAGIDSDGTLVSISVTTLPTAAQGILYLADGTTPVAAGAPLSP